MSLSTAMNGSVQGMNAQSTRLSAVADNLANIDTPHYQAKQTQLTTVTNGPQSGLEAKVVTPGNADGGVDPLAEMTNMVESEQSFELNADVFHTGADMWQALSTVLRE